MENKPTFNNLKINLSSELTGVVCTDGNDVLEHIDELTYYYKAGNKEEGVDGKQEVIIKFKDNKKENKIKNKKEGRVEIDTRFRKEKNNDDKIKKEIKKQKNN